jgi:hypothetical protein
MTANEVLDYCTSLNYAIFQYTYIPHDLYETDRQKYWSMKEDAVDEMLSRNLIDEHGGLYEHDDDYTDSMDWDNPEDLKSALVHYMKKAGEISGSIRY